MEKGNEGSDCRKIKREVKFFSESRFCKDCVNRKFFPRKNISVLLRNKMGKYQDGITCIKKIIITFSKKHIKILMHINTWDRMRTITRKSLRSTFNPCKYMGMRIITRK